MGHHFVENFFTASKKGLGMLATLGCITKIFRSKKKLFLFFKIMPYFVPNFLTRKNIFSL